MANRQLATIGAVIMTAALAAAAGEWSGVCVEVYDGDTLSVARGRQAVTVQLADVDAPEIDQPYGEEARDLVSQLLLGAEVRVIGEHKNSEGQIVARVLVGGVDASRRLLDAGLAWTGDTTDEDLILASMQARGERRGLWQEDSPTAPWRWRKRQQEMTPTPVPVIRSLRDAALIIQLKKNRDGRAVISGMRAVGDAESVEELVRAAGGLQSTFECDRAELESCTREHFDSTYRTAYDDDDPGAYELTNIDLGGGSITLMFSGKGRSGHSFGVPVSCQCNRGECACAMRMPVRDPLPEATPTPAPQPQAAADGD